MPPIDRDHPPLPILADDRRGRPEFGECVALLNETIERSLTQLVLGGRMRRRHAGRDLARELAEVDDFPMYTRPMFAAPRRAGLPRRLLALQLTGLPPWRDDQAIADVRTGTESESDANQVGDR